MYSVYSSSPSRQGTLNGVTDKLPCSNANNEVQESRKNERQEQPKKSRYRESLSELLNVLNDPICCEIDNFSSRPQEDFVCRKSKDENFPPFVETRSSVQITPSHASREFKRVQARRSCAYRCYPTHQLPPSQTKDRRLADLTQSTKSLKSKSSKSNQSLGNRFCQATYNTDRDMVKRETFFSYPPDFVGTYADQNSPASLPLDPLNLSNESFCTTQGWISAKSNSKEVISSIPSHTLISKNNECCSSHTISADVQGQRWLQSADDMRHTGVPACSASKMNVFNDDETIIPTRDNEIRRKEDCSCYSCKNVCDVLQYPVILHPKDRKVYQRTKPAVSYSSPDTMMMQQTPYNECKRGSRNQNLIDLRQPRFPTRKEAGDSPENLKRNTLPSHPQWNTEKASWHSENNLHSVYKRPSRFEKSVIREKFESDTDGMSSSSVFESVSTINTAKPRPASAKYPITTQTEGKEAAPQNVHNHIYLSCFDAFMLPKGGFKSSQHCLPLSKLIRVLERERRTFVKRHSALGRTGMSIHSKIRNKRRMLRKRKSTPIKFCRTSETLQISTEPSKRQHLCTLPANFANFKAAQPEKDEKMKSAEESVNVRSVVIEIEAEQRDDTPNDLETKTVVDLNVDKPHVAQNNSKSRSPRGKVDRLCNSKKNESCEGRSGHVTRPTQNAVASQKQKVGQKSPTSKPRSKERSSMERQRSDLTKTWKKPASNSADAKAAARPKPVSNTPLPVWKPAGVSKLPVTNSTTNVQKHRPTPWASAKEKVAPPVEHSKLLANKQVNPSEPLTSKPLTPRSPEKSVEHSEGRVSKINKTPADAKNQQRLRSGSIKDLSMETSKLKTASKISETNLKKPRTTSKSRPGTPRNLKHMNEFSTYDIKMSENTDETSQDVAAKSKSTTVLPQAEENKVQVERTPTFKIFSEFSETNLAPQISSGETPKPEISTKSDENLHDENSSPIEDTEKNVAESMANAENPFDCRSDIGTNSSLPNTMERSSSFIAVSDVASSKCCQVSFKSSTSLANPWNDQLTETGTHIDEDLSSSITKIESDQNVSQKFKRRSIHKHMLSLHELKEFLCSQGVSAELVDKAEQEILMKRQDRRKSVTKLSCSSLPEPAHEETVAVQENISVIPVVVHECSQNDASMEEKCSLIRHENATTTKKSANNVSSQTNRWWEKSSWSQTAALPHSEVATGADDLIPTADVGIEASVSCKSVNTMSEPTLKETRESQTNATKLRCRNVQTRRSEKRSVATCSLRNELVQRDTQCPSDTSLFTSDQLSTEYPKYFPQNYSPKSNFKASSNGVHDELITTFHMAKRVRNMCAAIEICKNTIASQTSLMERARRTSGTNTNTREKKRALKRVVHASTGFDALDSSEEEFQDAADTESANKQVALKPCSSVILPEVKSLMRLMLDRIKEADRSSGDYFIQEVSDANGYPHLDDLFPDPALTKEHILHLLYGTICFFVFWCLQFSFTCES